MQAPKTIQLLHFAKFSEQSGCSSERWTTCVQSGSELFQEVSAHYGFTLPQEQIRLAVNECFTQWNQVLHDGDVVAFIPPMSGG